jgi:uncharacterized protein involved in outer membrane biogenesis
MKKAFICISIGVVALIVVALVASIFFLGRIVKKGVETVGPRVAMVEVKLDSANVWLLPGRAQLRGLSIGNPPGYKARVAVKVGDISIRLNATTALSDKVIIDSITVKSPEITIEGGLKNNNLTQIQKNVNDYVRRQPDSSPAETKPDASPNATKSGKKFQINELVITGTRLRITGLFATGASISLSLPDIRLANLGAGAAGITSPEIAQKALAALLDSIVTNGADILGKDAVKKFDFKKAGEKLKGLFSQ